MITVVQYGVWHKWMRDVPRDVMDQLWLSHCVREDFVSTTLAYDARLKEIWSSFPVVGEAECRLLEASDALDVLLEEQRVVRQSSRSKKVSADLRSRLADARGVVRAARVGRRDAIQVAKDAAMPLIVQAKDAQREARRGLYAKYCSYGVPDRDGRVIRLYHATFNDVRVMHEAAEKRLASSRKQGGRGQMRHHRFDGTGTLCVSLLRTAGDPPRTPMVVANSESGAYRNVLGVPWVAPVVWEGLSRSQRRADGRVGVRMRVGYGDDLKSPTHVDIPVQAHRFLPAEADITGAKLSIRRRGTKLIGSLSITAKDVPDPLPVKDGPSIVLHWGWRDVPTGGAEVARWVSTSPLDIPVDMRGVFTCHDESRMSGAVIAPAVMFTKLDHVEALQSELDTAFNEARGVLSEWLRAHPDVVVDDPTSREPVVLTGAVVGAWRSHERLARLAWAWHRECPAGVEDMESVLWEWRCGHRHVSNIAANTRARAINARRDVYRNVAAVISGQCGGVGVDDMDLARLASRGASSELPDTVTAPGSRRRVYAAPGELRYCIVSACQKDGVTVVTLDTAENSHTCHACGYANPGDDRWLNPMVLCDGCGKVFDQNTNALLNLVDKYTATLAV